MPKVWRRRMAYGPNRTMRGEQVSKQAFDQDGGAGQTIHVVKVAELSRDQALGSKAWTPSSRKDNFEVGAG